MAVGFGAVVSAVTSGVDAPAAGPYEQAVRPSTTVVWVGDSITAGWVDELSAGLDTCDGRQIVWDAVAGRRVLDGQTIFGPIKSGLVAVADMPRAANWVVELGTNDVGAADPAALIDGLLAALPPGAHVSWVTVNNGGAAAEDAMNAAIRTHPGIDEVWDWNLYSAGHPEWFVDGIHPTLAGAEAMLAFYCSQM